MSENKEENFIGRKIFDIVFGATIVPFSVYKIATTPLSLITIFFILLLVAGIFSLYTAFFTDYAVSSKKADNLAKNFSKKVFKLGNYFDPDERAVRKVRKEYKKK